MWGASHAIRLNWDTACFLSSSAKKSKVQQDFALFSKVTAPKATLEIGIRYQQVVSMLKVKNFFNKKYMDGKIKVHLNEDTINRCIEVVMHLLT